MRRSFIVAASLATLVLRLIRVRAMPVFNDEAIALRWAQVTRSSWAHAFATPLRDPKPPLQTILLALFVRLGNDPVLVGRCVSAVIAMATTYILALLADELFPDRRPGVIVACLAACSPFLAFHQRLATVDALFFLESIVVLWLALRARPLFGAGLGLALETRGVFSILLAPVAALASYKRDRSVRTAALGFLIAGLLWLPYLTAQPSAYAQGILPQLRRRILYQSQFHAIGISLDPLVWLWTYLTPPVLIAAIAGFVYLTIRREWHVLSLLGTWTLALLLPALLGGVRYSRYALPAAAPLLIAAAWCLTHFRWKALAVAIVLLWPLYDVINATVDWRSQTLTNADRYQYIDGWPAGGATEQAVAWLTARAHESPIDVVTTNEWGLPADGVWLMFDRDPRVRLFFTTGERAFADKWGAETATTLPADRPTYEVTRATSGNRLPLGAVVFRNGERSRDLVVVRRLF